MLKQSESYLTTRKAAEMLGISVRTAQLWATTGVLQSWTTAGGHRRILEKSVQELLAQREQESAIGSGNAASSQKNNDEFSILLVEDDPKLLKLFKQQIQLAQLSNKIYTASDGYKGLLLTGEKRPDLIITDLMMPGMDGFRMLKAIKQQKQFLSIQFIVISALDSSDIERNGGLPKDIQLLQKPVLFKSLEKAIRKCYENKMSMKQYQDTA